MVLVEILLASIFVSLLAFSGLFIVRLEKSLQAWLIPLLVSLAAGVLLGDAFIHIAPEAIGAIGASPAMLYLLAGFILFFVIEKLLFWHHCRDPHHDVDHASLTPKMILLGDSAHNIFDGIAIAASFITDLRLGVFTTLAIMLHEIPQEIGDFGVLLSNKMKLSEAVKYIFIAQTTAILGALGAFFFLQSIAGLEPALLAITGGGLSYIAASDLIPGLPQEKSLKGGLTHILAFTTGALLMYLLKLYVG